MQTARGRSMACDGKQKREKGRKKGNEEKLDSNLNENFFLANDEREEMRKKNRELEN